MTLAGRRTRQNLVARFCYLGIVFSPIWPLMPLPRLPEEPSPASDCTGSLPSLGAGLEGLSLPRSPIAGEEIQLLLIPCKH